MPSRLGEQFGEIEVPDSSAAKDAAVREAAGDGDAAASRRRLGPRRVALLVAAVIAFCLTPPGSSALGELVELVGIGDEPSDDFPFGGPEIPSDGVLAVGTTPSGERFEIAKTGGRGPGDQGCFYVSYPSSDLAPGSASCVNAGVLRRLAKGNYTPSPFLTLRDSPAEPGSGILVTMEAGGEIASATLSGGRETAVSSAMTVVSASLEVPADQPQVTVSYMAGFLPLSVLGDPDTSAHPGDLEAGDPDSGSYPGLAEALENVVVETFGADGQALGRFDAKRPFFPHVISEDLFELARESPGASP